MNSFSEVYTKNLELPQNSGVAAATLATPVPMALLIIFSISTILKGIGTFHNLHRQRVGRDGFSKCTEGDFMRILFNSIGVHP